MLMDGRQNDKEYFDLLEFLLAEQWLRIPHQCIKDCGPAAQTFGGFLNISKRQSFVPIADIASAACLAKRTVQRHLDTLHERGWLINRGRDRLANGWLRRTSTRQVMHRHIVSNGRYIALPCIANFDFPGRVGKIGWPTKVIFGLICAELLKLHTSQLIDELDQVCDYEDRFCFSLTKLERTLGIDRKSIIAAKRTLHHAGVIEWSGNSGGSDTDSLCPLSEFTISRWPAERDGWSCFKLTEARPK